jgi:hypothetical protein
MRLLVAVFAVLALITAVQTLLSRRAAGESGAVWSTILFTTSIWAAWVVLIPALVWLGRRFDFRPGHRATSAALRRSG